MRGLMFSLCVFSYIFFLFFTFPPKPDSGPKPELQGRMTLTWKEFRQNFSQIHLGFWREGHFTKFIIDSLTHWQQ